MYYRNIKESSIFQTVCDYSKSKTTIDFQELISVTYLDKQLALTLWPQERLK